MTENPPRALACGYICKSQTRLFVSCEFGVGGGFSHQMTDLWVGVGGGEEGGGIIRLCGVCFHPAGERHV